MSISLSFQFFRGSCDAFLAQDDAALVGAYRNAGGMLGALGLAALYSGAVTEALHAACDQKVAACKGEWAEPIFGSTLQVLLPLVLLSFSYFFLVTHTCSQTCPPHMPTSLLTACRS
jgi:hypothetical protein